MHGPGVLVPASGIDTLIGLIETRRMAEELWMALAALDGRRPVELGTLIGENAPFRVACGS